MKKNSANHEALSRDAIRKLFEYFGEPLDDVDDFF